MISDKALNFIKQWEGFSARAYQCSANRWTIGYGETMWKGKPVHEGMTVTRAEADAALVTRLIGFQKELDGLVHVPLNSNQNAAMLSFIYNIGAPNLKKSTLLKLLNQGNYDYAAAQFEDWNKAAGKEVAGLTNRRKAECELFLKG